VAVERELIARNPARGKRRRLKERKPQRTWLDRVEQITALLDAAAELDAEARVDRQALCRRSLLATLTFAGLRISEALDLRWRDVDLAAGRLRVGESKTDAGVRSVDLVPILREELSIHKARTKFADMGDYVFPTERGRRQDRNNARRRAFALSVERANRNLADVGRNPLPEGLTPHSLRRTFISVQLALGEDVPYVMRQVGHSDPKVTLSIYAQVMFRGEGEAERLKALVEGAQWPNNGTSAVIPTSKNRAEAPTDDQNPASSGDFGDGHGWFRTSDLSRVKRALSH
jgi:integrase